MLRSAGSRQGQTVPSKPCCSPLPNLFADFQSLAVEQVENLDDLQRRMTDDALGFSNWLYREEITEIFELREQRNKIPVHVFLLQ